jgi:hypothetical protein
MGIEIIIHITVEVVALVVAVEETSAEGVVMGVMAEEGEVVVTVRAMTHHLSIYLPWNGTP